MLHSLLVKIFFGKDIQDYPESEQATIISQATDKFAEYLYLKIQQKVENDPKAKHMATRLKAAHKFHDREIFKKFPELENYMMEAYREFVEDVKVKSGL